jgi:peptidoglycan hydrolase-like protein with peptidoglycan-binding domain
MPMLSVAQAQIKLNALGFKVGAADGKIGAKTRAALKSFQRKHGIAVSGELDATTSEKLSE